MSKEIIVYAIRDKSTGYYLPPGSGHNGRGASYQKPRQVGTGVLPRFFYDYEHAKRCLQKWLQGIHEGDGNEYERYVHKIIKQPDRIPENMEIVRVSIMLDT